MSCLGYTWWALRGGGPYRVVFYEHWGFGLWSGWRYFEWKPRRTVWEHSWVFHWLCFEIAHSKQGFHIAAPMREWYENQKTKAGDS